MLPHTVRPPPPTHTRCALPRVFLAPCSALDRDAEALAELADTAGAPLSPRSRHAYERICREFDRLAARVSGWGWHK